MLLNFKTDPNKADIFIYFFIFRFYFIIYEVLFKNFFGATPLHIAGDRTDPVIVHLLIQAGANPSIRNDFGVSAGEMCINRGMEAALNPEYDPKSPLLATL